MRNAGASRVCTAVLADAAPRPNLKVNGVPCVSLSAAEGYRKGTHAKTLDVSFFSAVVRLV